MKISEDSATLNVQGLLDDGSDRIIVSPKVAKRAVITGTARLKDITPVSLHVTLKSGE